MALGAEPILTYAGLVERAARLAHSFRHGWGAAPGDRLAIVMENRCEYLEIELAAWWAGLVIVPLNAKPHPSEIAWILEDAAPVACLTSPKLAGVVHEAVAGQPIRVVEVGSAAYRRLLEAEPLPMAEVAGGALAWLFYTSGTTGRPKGAMITHGNLRAMTYAFFADVDQVGPREAILHAAPMSHGSGCYIAPMAAAGACHVVPESGGFEPAELAALIAAWPGSHLFAAPTMVRRLVQWAVTAGPDLASLATIVYGGAPMYLADLKAAHAVLGHRLAQIYGQGESPMCITALDKVAHAKAARAGRSDLLRSAGTAQLVIELEIRGPDGRALPAGEVGEITARGASVVPGYWRNFEATARTMGDGWLRTGDLGALDEGGFLTIKDRSKDLIISGGSNIYPREVEDALLTHPGVREACVIGLPDAEWGEQVVACVVVAEGTSEAELEAQCLARIARFKRPKRYVFLEALPKSAYGKILKRELREQLFGSSGRLGG